MSKIFLLGKPQDVITQTFFSLCRTAGHQVHIYDDIDDVESIPEEPLEAHELPDFVIICHHGWMDYHSLPEFLEALSEEHHPIVLLSGISTSGYATTYDTPFFDREVISRLIMYSPLAFYQGRHVIEFAPTKATDPEALAKAKNLFQSLQVKAYEITDTPGLVLPRVLAMLVNEAASAVMEGVASPEDIDTAMKLGTNYPEGPLAWADKIGIDVICQILDTLVNEYFEDRYRPVLLLKQMAGSGKLGVKTGEGFYIYEGSKTELEETSS